MVFNSPSHPKVSIQIYSNQENTSLGLSLKHAIQKKCAGEGHLKCDSKNLQHTMFLVTSVETLSPFFKD